ncbi:MAG: hypothetical protein J7J36_02250 [Thermoplasmata archaeon]|nr:hypothetical protein [Thermoplasmata archaeon]
MAVFTALPIFLPLAMAANFEFHINDARGDVGNADIDIIQAGSNIKGSNLVFYMKVVGNINSAYSYTFGLNDGSNDVGATYTSGIPYYVGISSGGQPAYNISGNELTMDVPYSAISQLNADTTTFKVIAADVTTHTVDYAVYTSGNGGNDRNENNTNNANDPTKGEVTDKSIDVSITDASYTVSKENANSISGSVMVKGTTNGVDHVSLCFVVYYKNGTYDYGS